MPILMLTTMFLLAAGCTGPHGRIDQAIEAVTNQGTDGAAMVPVSGGTFSMGSRDVEVSQAIEDCKTQLQKRRADL